MALAGAWVPQAHAADGLPPDGWLVQLRPGATPEPTETALPLAVRDTPQARRERAQVVWQQRHAERVQHLRALGADLGLAVRSVGTAGSALRLDLSSLNGRSADAVLRQLRLHPDVLSVVPNERLHRTQAAGVPSDPLYVNQWHLQPSTSVLSGLNMGAAWGRHTGVSNPVTVAVVDTGVRFDHPDLSGRLWPGYDFVSELSVANDGNGRDADPSDPGDWITAQEARTTTYSECTPEDSSWHGTAIAGIVAAGANNGVGVAGVNWGANVLPVRVAGKCGAVLSDLLDGVRWAAGLPVAGVPANPNPARIINLSYGGSGPCNTTYQATIDDVVAAGALMVVAAGNSSAPLTRPADCSGVLPVTAVRADGTKAGYASYGPQVSLAAPGGSALSGSADVGLLTTHNSGRTVPSVSTYDALAGTSFSSPLVAAVASLMVSARPDLTGAELTALLRGSVRPHTANPSLPQCDPGASTQNACNCTTQTCGAGLLDADKALSAAQAYVRGVTVIPTPTPTPVASGGGALGPLWGLALWVWLGLVAWGAGLRRRA